MEAGDTEEMKEADPVKLEGHKPVVDFSGDHRKEEGSGFFVGEDGGKGLPSPVFDLKPEFGKGKCRGDGVDFFGFEDVVGIRFRKESAFDEEGLVYGEPWFMKRGVDLARDAAVT